MFRDIACRNCLVNASRTVKLADFGMTRAMFESDYYRFSRKGAYYLAEQYSFTKTKVVFAYVERKPEAGVSKKLSLAGLAQLSRLRTRLRFGLT
jgi:hypothetical protein